MLSPGQEDDVRRRISDDPAHTFAQHLQCLIAEQDAELRPLSGNPISDEEKHRWIVFIRDTKFLSSYAEAAQIFTTRVLPQLRQAVQIHAEQLELSRRVAAVQPRTPTLTIAEQRMAQRLRLKNAEKARKAAAMADGTPPAEPAKASVCVCCRKGQNCECRSKKSTSDCSCSADCKICITLECNGVGAEVRPTRQDAA